MHGLAKAKIDDQIDLFIVSIFAYLSQWHGISGRGAACADFILFSLFCVYPACVENERKGYMRHMYLYEKDIV